MPCLMIQEAFSKSFVKILLYQVWAEAMNVGQKPLYVCYLIPTILFFYLHCLLGS